ncbi:REP-associated tyrosine transposase [Pseudodesulfovibrio sediminis]|uniref:REP-associated tyrosine transposase n=1 Tax=Pseudodesulfovibrio sediminis TaxID=2810563 RepID=UPI001E316954|nr:transposase [Pseudodesulfovibrio sediminis]
MARPLRIEYPDAFYHVIARGNARLPIFEDDSDRECFLALLGTVSDRFNFVFHSFVLMGNHYHLLLETPDANLSAGMRHINGVYTQSFNRRHGRSGHVFQGRYKAILVDAEEYLVQLSRYVVLNPVRAGMVEKAEEYPWSNYGYMAGLAAPPEWLLVSTVLSCFGENRQQAHTEYQRFVNAPHECDDFREKLSGGVFLGSQCFKESISAKLNKSRKIKEISSSARFASRPPLEKLVPRNGFANREERN